MVWYYVCFLPSFLLVDSGLIFLHRHHIIHRDLKPENILLKRAPNGEVHYILYMYFVMLNLLDAMHCVFIEQIIYKLTDFGYAKAYESSSYTDSMVGTPQYVVS